MYKLDELRNKITAMADISHLAWTVNKEMHIKEAGGGPTLIPHRIYMHIDDVSESVLEFVIATTETGKAYVIVRDPQSSIVANLLRKSLNLLPEQKPEIIVPKLEIA